MSEKDVSMEIETRNGKANPFGWSWYELWHKHECIGALNCGYPEITAKGYRAEEVPEGENRTRLKVYCEKTDEEWDVFNFVEAHKKALSPAKQEGNRE